MAEEQPTFKVVDRRPFNPDGTPRELSAEEKEAQEAAQAKAAATEPRNGSFTGTEPATPARPEPEPARVASEPQVAREQERARPVAIRSTIRRVSSA